MEFFECVQNGTPAEARIGREQQVRDGGALRVGDESTRQ
jgi:hypothetical protein